MVSCSQRLQRLKLGTAPEIQDDTKTPVYVTEFISAGLETSCYEVYTAYQRQEDLATTLALGL